MSLKTNHFCDFGNFRVDFAEKTLLRDGKTVPITPKVFETLCVLVENAGRLIEKDELMQKIWQDRFVEEGNLTFNIKMLRKALGDSASQPQFIETVPRRGYRFIAEINKIADETAPNIEEIDQSTAVAASPVPSKFQNLFKSLVIAALLVISVIGLSSWYRRSSKTAAPVLSASFSLEKLSTNGKVGLAVISPDGKNVVYRAENGGRQSIWLRQLDSATNVELIAPSEDIYFGLNFSPDSTFIYFNRSPRHVTIQTTIYRISIFGGVPIKITDNAQGWISISPDGEKISFVRCYYTDDEFCSLWIADARDGKNERKLVSRPRPTRIADNEISPDGKSIAFAVGQSENQSNEFSLNQVNIESGAESQLITEKFFNIKSLSWLPNNSDLLIAASRIPNKNFRLWQVSTVHNDAMPLTKDSEDYSALSLTSAADVISAVQIKSDFNLFLYDWENPADKKILTDATTVGFAPGGKIFFASSMSDNEEVWSINSDGSGRKQLTTDAADDSEPILSPDGSSIFFSSNRTGAVHVWRMNADGSNQVQITEAESGFPVFVSPDGRWIYFQHGLHRTLWRASTSGGGEQIVLDKRKYRFAFSPDGSQIAFSEKNGEERILTIVSLSDGQTVKTFPTPIAKTKITEIEWLPDGKSVAYTLANQLFENNTLWIQPLNAEKTQKILDLGDSQVLSLALSPDGKKLAVVQGVWKSDAVLLRGLK